MRTLAPIRAGLLTQAALALLTGCSGGGGDDGTVPTPTPPPAPPPPAVSGLDSRPPNATCLAGDAPDSAVSLRVERAFPNLPDFTQPIAMLQEPGNSARWYVVQKTGSVRVFDNNANVSSTREFIN